MDFSDVKQYWAAYIVLGFVIGLGWRLSGLAWARAWSAYEWAVEMFFEARNWLRDRLEQGR